MSRPGKSGSGSSGKRPPGKPSAARSAGKSGKKPGTKPGIKPATKLKAKPAPKPDGRTAVRLARELAALGMTLEEIAAWLGWKLPLRSQDERSLRSAMEEGRLLGRAAMKKALFEAATQGKLQAQRELLLRLEHNGETHEGQAFEVRRIILGGEADHGGATNTEESGAEKWDEETTPPDEAAQPWEEPPGSEAADGSAWEDEHPAHEGTDGEDTRAEGGWENLQPPARRVAWD